MFQRCADVLGLRAAVCSSGSSSSSLMVAEAFEKVRTVYSAVFLIVSSCVLQCAAGAAAAAHSGHDGGRGLSEGAGSFVTPLSSQVLQPKFAAAAAAAAGSGHDGGRGL
jgi:hypothetical protein